MSTPSIDEPTRAVLAAAGVDPALVCRPDPELLRATRLAMALGQRLSLDVEAQAGLLHYLRLLESIDQRLRTLHAAPASHPTSVTRERPTPWHEPHG